MKQSNGPQSLQLHSLPSSSIQQGRAIDWDRYSSKSYLHFDQPINIEKIKDKIEDPQWVSKYSFYPFMHFSLVMKRFRMKDGVKQKDPKERAIFYAAHKDQFIYKYYGDLLNNAYNEYAKKSGIDDVAIAYRNNKGKSNIDFSYEVFDFILKTEESYILAIDFKSFFDTIAHKPLKQNIQRVLNTDMLEEDWYKVYRNTTKFSYVHIQDYEEFLKDKYDIKYFKKCRKDKNKGLKITPAEFRNFKKRETIVSAGSSGHRKVIQRNGKSYGIPQGSGMSAVCSNVLLIDFDYDLLEWARNNSGLYRRYSDDLILVIPGAVSKQRRAEIDDELEAIFSRYESLGLEIQKEKTVKRLYKDREITNENSEKSSLDYLGFVLDGRQVRLREKSLFKYYSRAYKKVKVSNKISLATGTPPPVRDLYNLYTHLGWRHRGYGNFITYAYKAHKKMKKLKVQSHIRDQVKRHWHKINKRLL
ncbi:reverse transcriptase [Planococcaceae bacterium Storch 2/2-2]|nr:reverse transcriptase [Planococcaceae bacterium Storch 2/2-2]